MKALHTIALWLTYLNAGAAVVGCAYVLWQHTGWIGIVAAAVLAPFLFYPAILLIPLVALIFWHVWWLAGMVYIGTALAAGARKLYIVLMFKKYGATPDSV